ncbi:MAG: glutathione synthase [Gammaproteobacteria bacterium]|nr:glutathione synthase [Gammaproteobacteria bacterium]
MRHVFIMDPLDSVKPWKDTSYFIMLAAAERGHRVYHTGHAAMTLRHERLVADVRELRVRADQQHPFDPFDVEEIDLASVDVVWERTDPPVNRRYLYASLFLDFLPPSVCVVNRPRAIRDFNEKLAALKFPDLTPPTLVTSRPGKIREFIGAHGRIVLKPVDGHGGKGIEFCDATTPGLDELLARVTGHGRHWIVVQAYLPLASEGDKRILLLDGEPLGAVLRLHAEGSELNNLDQGRVGKRHRTDRPRPRDLGRSGSGAARAGIIFAGIDVIGGQLMEVNVTSPTGLQEAARFAGEPLHHRIIEHLERSSA